MSGKVSRPITNTNHGGYVVLSIWACFFSALLFWSVRIIYRWRRVGLRLDDAFLMSAMGLALAQSICLQFAVNAGLGKRTTPDQQVHFIDFEKLFYASNLLNILCQACSKVSVALLIHQLQPFRAYVVANYASLAFIAAWATASFLSLTFKCDLPNPWRIGLAGCLNLRTLFMGIDIANIISEAILVAIPALLMPTIETTNNIRLTVTGCFAARLGVIAALIGHIVTLHRLLDYEDATWSYTIPAIWFQVVVNVSVLTACIPGVQHILSELRAGLLTIKVDSDGPEPGRYGSVFGTNSNHIRTDVSGNEDTKVCEMSRMNSGSDARRLTLGRRRDADTITVTKVVNQAEERLLTSANRQAY